MASGSRDEFSAGETHCFFINLSARQGPSGLGMNLHHCTQNKMQQQKMKNVQKGSFFLVHIVQREVKEKDLEGMLGSVQKLSV